METARNMQLEKAVMTLEFIGQQKPGWKTRGIKDTDGEWWNVPLYEVDDLRPGQTYHVEFTRNAKGYRTIESIAPAMAPRPETPTPQQNGKKMDYWSPKPRDPREQKMIWINSMLGREIEMGRGFMSEDQLVARAQVHAKVWDRLFANEQELAT